MFGIAALVTGRFGEGWLADTRRATLVAWGFLTVGIILGAWWSYEVLGWGGFWAWDPVENASLLPVAHRHRVHPLGDRPGAARDAPRLEPVARHRHVLPHHPRHVPHALRASSTRCTRSRSPTSARGCSRSSASSPPPASGCIAWRGDQLRAPGRIDSAVSRESAFLANNLLFAGAGVRRAARHRVPAGRRGAARQPAVGRGAVLRPHGHADRARAAVPDGRRARAAVARDERRSACGNRLLVPAWIGGLTMLVAVVARRPRAGRESLAYGLGAFATAGIVRQFVLGVRGRRRALGEPRAVALGRATRSNPRLYGGLVVHFGVVLIAVVLAASSAYGANRDVKLAEAASRRRCPGTRSPTSARTDRSATRRPPSPPTCEVEQGDRDLGVYAPAISTYPNSTEGIGTPSVHTGLVDDVYLTLVSSPKDGRAGSRSACASTR